MELSFSGPEEEAEIPDMSGPRAHRALGLRTDAVQTRQMEARPIAIGRLIVNGALVAVCFGML